MTPAREAELDHLLSDWHSFVSDRVEVRGFARAAAGCEDYRSSRQYDDVNGALDDDLDARILSGVGRCIGRMDEPYQTAIYENARNLSTGVTVWQSPRLPRESYKRDEILAVARENLWRLLQRDGVVQ